MWWLIPWSVASANLKKKKLAATERRVEIDIRSFEENDMRKGDERAGVGAGVGRGGVTVEGWLSQSLQRVSGSGVE